MPLSRFQELFDTLRRYREPKAYATLTQACRAAVTEWRWATSLMTPELPYDEIVRGDKPPKWTKKQTAYGFLHGLDARGRILYGRSDALAKPDKEVYEQFFIHVDNGFWCLCFDKGSKKALVAVRWYEINGARWLCFREIGYHGVREQVLVWEAERLVKYVDQSWQKVTIVDKKAPTPARLEKEAPTEVFFEYTYNADGELERVMEGTNLDEEREVRYQRIPKGMNLQSLLLQAEDLHVAAIPDTIRAAKIREPVYGLLIQYTGVDTDPGGFGPPLFLATEKMRKRLQSQYPNEAPWSLWEAPGDPEAICLSSENPALDAALQLIFQITVVQVSPTNYRPVRKMFQRVCARLNLLDWAGVVPTTDDFVVLPFDTHDEFDHKADLKACVPVEKLRLLIARGYISRMKL